MKRNKDFTSDAVKESIGKTMTKIQAYVGKNWAQGKECKVIKHVQELLHAEIDKYLASGAAAPYTSVWQTVKMHVGSTTNATPKIWRNTVRT